MCNKLKYYSSEDFGSIDTPIVYSKKFDEYGIKVIDGGSSSVKLEFCPWCGESLPKSKRGEWFNELERIGIVDPWTETIPEKYQTDEGYRDRLENGNSEEGDSK